MTENRTSVIRRFCVGIASVPLRVLRLAILAVCACWISGPLAAIANETPAKPEVFLGAMSRCLDWIAADAPNEVPLGGWVPVTVFPTGRTETGAEAGAYRDPASTLVVSLERDTTRVTCSGQGGGVTLASLGQTFNEWVGQETGAGRIGIVTDGAGAFGYAMGVCVGLQGGADIIRADDESLIFYFETGQAVPPGGVCDA